MLRNTTERYFLCSAEIPKCTQTTVARSVIQTFGFAPMWISFKAVLAFKLFKTLPRYTQSYRNSHACTVKHDFPKRNSNYTKKKYRYLDIRLYSISTITSIKTSHKHRFSICSLLNFVLQFFFKHHGRSVPIFVLHLSPFRTAFGSLQIYILS
jgi:hypothetical protein